MSVAPIDLLHLDSPGVIGCYLLETEDGPALFDCGPTTCVEHLKAGLRERGLALSDIRHLLLSHIHLDHAGAAGVLVREHPSLQVHVSEVGAPHIVDPSKLETSARRLYGDAFDALWGELAPVPEQNVHIVGDVVVGFECFPTPGHAWHHVSYLDAQGTLYAGDAAGVRVGRGSFVMPPCPPPEFDLAAWEQTIHEIGRRGPDRLALIHFGVYDDVQEHLTGLRETLSRWAEWIEDGMDEQTFVAAARHDVSQTDSDLADHYDRAAPVLAPLPGNRAVLAQAPRGGDSELAERVRLEVGHGDELERRGVRRLEHHGRRDSRLECLLPARGDDAPPVARHEAGKHPLRLRRRRGRSRRTTENSRNSSVITAQTTWKPRSEPSVRQ